MERENIVPAEGKEMNFIDLCAAGWRALGRGIKALGRLLAHMLRLTYAYWWVVLVVMALAVVAALYYTRKDNITYKMNAVAYLNGPTIPQFEQSYAPLRSGRFMDNPAIRTYIEQHKVKQFETFRVVDCMDDGTADFVDFKRKSSMTDTVKVPMQDRICLQFRIKSRDLELVPQIEEAILAYLNSSDVLQQSYVTFLPDMEEEVAFNHHQAQKLDSLTSAYYFFHASNASPMNYNGNGVNFYGDRRIRLFLDEIYEQRTHMQQADYRMQFTTAPVVLENHFTADPKPVNGRMKYLLLFLLFGWGAGCALAELIHQRKAICAWLQLSA